MKAASILALIGCLATVTEPKIYPRCKLAKMLLRAGMDNFQGFHFENWICMAYCESRYNTTAQKVLKDGSIDYGIFQINSYTWCRRAELEGMNFRHVACSDLLTDDLTDAIICAKKIAHETEGMNYWFQETYSDLRKTAAADQTRLHSEVQQWCQRGWSTPFSTRV